MTEMLMMYLLGVATPFIGLLLIWLIPKVTGRMGKDGKERV